MMSMGNIGTTGGCCVTRYESDKIDRIMHRFRLIAPKPTKVGSSPDNTSRGGDSYIKIGKGKRKYKTDDLKINCNKRSKASPEAMTPPRTSPNSPIWLNFKSGTAEKDGVDNTNNRPMHYTPTDRTGVTSPRGTRGTIVTLECLTYTMVNVDALGRTDKERVMNLERDTCPGFVSDRLSRITWSNAAFGEMVEIEGFKSGAGVAMKESVGEGVRAFSCRVRVHVESRKMKTMTVPCDVWRMDCGGLAWRLDVRSALSLGM